MKPGPHRRHTSLPNARTDSGYGTTVPKFHKPRQASSSYPYVDEDEHVDVEVGMSDEEMDAFVKKINSIIVPSDPLAKRSTDPFYFAGAATKLSDCFTRPFDVLNEVEVASNSMYSVPKMYKGKKVGPSGASTNITTSPMRRTGTKSGWSSSPPPVGGDEEYYSINTIKDLPDETERGLINVRLAIRAIMKDQLEEAE